MKIVNINEYNDNEGLQKKLRQRMDTYEPELSASVWDRIQHEMDTRDANRKKRFFWWLSSVAMVVLASGIISFLVWGGDEQNTQIAQQTTTIQKGNTRQETATQAENSTSATTESEAAPIVNNQDGITTPLAQATSNNTNSNRPSATNANGGNANSNQPDNAEATPAVITTNNGDNTKPEAPQNGNDTKTTEQQNTVVTTDEPKAKETDALNAPATEEPAVDDKKKEEQGQPTATTTKEKTQRWFVGVVAGYNQTFRTVTDINPNPAYPSAKERNRFEQKSYSPTYGIEFGFFPVKNFFIKTGVNIYQTTEQVRYDIHNRVISAVAAIYGNENDSVSTGSGTQHQNTYNYVQIPIEIGYSRTLVNSFGIMVSGGVAYNKLQNYSYYMYEPYYKNAFIPSTATEAKPYSNMYKSYVMLSGSVGVQYTFGKNWVANLGVNYRKAVTNAADEKYGVEVKPYSVGVLTGLAFKF